MKKKVRIAMDSRTTLRSQCALLTCVLSCAWTLAGQEGWALKVANLETAAMAKITEAKTNNDYKPLEDIEHLLYKFGEDRDAELRKHWGLFADKLTHIKLEVLQTAYALRDSQYDLKNHPKFSKSVMPPLGSAPVGVSGMDPKYVVDPAVRKQYELDIAENNRRKEKYYRESRLQSLYDSHLREIHTELESAQNSNAASLDHYLGLVNDTIRDESVKKKILSVVKKGEPPKTSEDRAKTDSNDKTKHPCCLRAKGHVWMALC